MSRVGTWCWAWILSVFGCGKSGEDGINVSGKVENPIKGELVVLNQFEFTGLKPIDTIEVDPSGAFEFYVKPAGAYFLSTEFLQSPADEPGAGWHRRGSGDHAGRK